MELWVVVKVDEELKREKKACIIDSSCVFMLA